MDRKIQNYAAMLMQLLHASAELKGSAAYPYIHGYVRFYQTRNCLLIAEEITDLPHSHSICQHPVFGFYIYDGNQCDGDMQDPFSGAMAHYNPAKCNHPFHAGDLPPLFGNHGYAFSIFLINRFLLLEVLGKTVIIHGNPMISPHSRRGMQGRSWLVGGLKAVRNGAVGSN